MDLSLPLELNKYTVDNSPIYTNIGVFVVLKGKSLDLLTCLSMINSFSKCSFLLFSSLYLAGYQKAKAGQRKKETSLVTHNNNNLDR